MATAIAFVAGNFLVLLLAFFLAFLVAQSRLMFRIHTLREVFFGALLGVLFTVLVFQLIR
jgi:diacylglycerol kinase (ATP)